MKLSVMTIDGQPLPAHAKPGDAGLDLALSEKVVIEPGSTKFVKTGVCVAIPEGYFGLCVARSSLAKRGLTVFPGIIDSGYRGEIKVILHNAGFCDQVLDAGERIAQLIVIPYASCDCVRKQKLDDTVRGDAGFGSTGKS